MTSVLFVCLANICRSPAMEATLRHLAVKKNLGEKLYVDSCGIGWVHLGERPDPRSFEAAKKHGIVIDHITQQFQDHFFDDFDLILTVDQDMVEQLKARATTPEQKEKILVATHFSKKFKGQPIPDPYYMGAHGFDQVMEMILDSCDGVIKHLFRSDLV